MAEATPHHDPNAALPLHGLVPAHGSPLALHQCSPQPFKGVQAERGAQTVALYLCSFIWYGSSSGVLIHLKSDVVV